MPVDQLEAFHAALSQAVSEQLGEVELYPRILTDGELNAAQLSLASLDELAALAPYGREFDAPLFEATSWSSRCVRWGPRATT